MNFRESRGRDGFFKGLLAGVVAIPIVVLVLQGAVDLLAELSGRADLLLAPRVQLFSLAVLVILCRWLIVGLKMEETGKGMLLVVFITAIAYFVYSFKFRHGF